MISFAPLAQTMGTMCLCVCVCVGGYTLPPVWMGAQDGAAAIYCYMGVKWGGFPLFSRPRLGYGTVKGGGVVVLLLLLLLASAAIYC